MKDARPAERARQHTIAAKLDAEQFHRFELAVAASGLSNSAFIRTAVLRQIVPLRPYEPLLAEAIATLAACRRTARRGIAADDWLVGRLDRLIVALHFLAGTRLA